MSQQAILTALYEHLNPVTSTGVTFKTQFGGNTVQRGRIYQETAKRENPLPLCVFRVVGESTTGYLGAATISSHELTVEIELFYGLGSGIAAAMTAETLLFAELHGATIATTSASIADIAATCISRGTPTIFDDAVSVTASYRVLASKHT